MMKKKTKSLQYLLFKQIKRKSSDPKECANEIASLLGLATSSVYRRINCESNINMDELMKLVKYYNISLDNLLFTNTSNVSFDFEALERPIQSIDGFIQNIEDDLLFMRQHKDMKISYASKDIPIFHFFNFKELTLFKFFIWGRTIWELPDLQDKKFSLKKFSVGKKVLNRTRSILELYNKIEGTEIWSTSILDNTLSQINYYVYSELFEKPEEALLLCKQLRTLLDHLYEIARLGKKFSYGVEPEEKGTFSLYQNELTLINNTILAESSRFNAVYLTVDTPNFMKSDDDKLCNYKKEWFEKIKRRSQLISVEAERSRVRFFNQLNKRLNIAEANIRSTI